MARPLSATACRGDLVSGWIENPPPQDLQGWVDGVWVGMGGWPRLLRLLPDGCADLVWNGDELALHQAQCVARYEPVTLRQAVVGLRLTCGVAGPLGASGKGSAVRRLPDVWGRAARDATTRLRRARDPEQQLEVLVQLVREQRHIAREPDPAVLHAVKLIRQQLNRPVEGLAREVDLSPRELRRRFIAHTGINPKSLQRVARASALLEALQTRDLPLGLAGLAADLGYVDQAHMTHECRTVLGATPGRLKRSAQREPAPKPTRRR